VVVVAAKMKGASVCEIIKEISSVLTTNLSLSLCAFSLALDFVLITHISGVEQAAVEEGGRERKREFERVCTANKTR
jgi:hypothetical protein